MRYYIARFFIPCISLLCIFYFLYHLLEGERGLSVYLKLEKDLIQAEEKLEGLKKHHQFLKKTLSHLHPEHIDQDYMDEIIRSELGVMPPADEEKIIILEEEFFKK